MIDEMIVIFEKRKRQLTDTLMNQSDDMSPEQMHQMYGALNEVNLFINTLRYYKIKQAAASRDDLNLINDAKSSNGNFLRSYGLGMRNRKE